MASLHISINAEPIFYVGKMAVTNSMFTSLIVSLIILTLAYFASKSIDPKARRPKGLQNFLEAYVEAFWGLVQSSSHNLQATAVIFPIVASVFIYILFNNWYGLMPWVPTIGINEPAKNIAVVNEVLATTTTSEHDLEVAQEHLEEAVVHDQAESSETHEEGVGSEGVHKKFVPIFRPATADLNGTIALALMSVAATQFIGLKFLGASYLTKFFNLKGIGTFVGFLELLSEFSKIISFAFRLFGNILAGEVLLAVINSLIPLLLPLPFFGLEIFVGLIQALVFAMLTIVFMSLATHAHED